MRLPRDVGDRDVLLDDALRRVDEDERDIGPLRRLERAQLRVVVDALPVPALAPQAGGVDRGRTSGLPARAPCRSASRVVPGNLADDHPLAPEQRVDEARLADVRAAEDRDADRVVRQHRRGAPARAVPARRRPGRAGRPRPCRAGRRSGSGRRGRAGGTRGASGSSLGSSILFASTSTGLRASRRICATSSSPGVTPARASTTKRTRSASPTASRACAAIARVSGAGSAMSTPPVSTRTNRLPVHSQTSSFRSRVTPDISCTTAALRLGEPVEERRLADVREADDRHRSEQRRRRRRAGRSLDSGCSRLAHLGGSALRGRPASCRSHSHVQSRYSSASISSDASR